jgi:pimeloyl-ACP methyl ester carboxylesterase
MLSLDSLKLFVTNQGKGEPTLVFLHYFSGAAASWQWVIEPLKADFHCVALDLPGFGSAPPLAEPTLQNYSAFIQEALGQLGVRRCVLIGHSMGGKLALQAATDGIDGLEQVILVAPSPPTQEPMPEEERDRMLRNHQNPDVASTTVDGAAQQTLPAIRRAIAIRTHIQAEDKTWRWWLLDGMNHSIAEPVSQLQMPVTVIASKDDPVIPWETIHPEVMAVLAQGELISYTDVGHLIPLEVPERLAESIYHTVNSASSTQTL